MSALDPATIEQLAAADPDRVLAAGFAAPGVRDRLLALAAFNHELARAREVASEPALGAIRLQWWREVVDEIFAGATVRRHPVAQALAAAVQAAGLPRGLLEALVDARAAEFERAPFATLAQLEDWLDQGAGNLVRLSLLAGGMPALGQVADRLARAGGIAFGLAGIMRALPWWHGRGATPLPLELLAEQGLDADRAIASVDGTACRPVLERLAQRVVLHHREARRLAVELARGSTGQTGDALAGLSYLALSSRYARHALRHGSQRPVLLIERQLRLVVAVATGCL